MSRIFTIASVEALSPDAASLKAAQKLRNITKWSNIGANAQAVWGECQGSGKKPYQTRVDIRGEVAFKCSCPSRKFPCKHSLALLFLFVEEQARFIHIDMPSWVSEWLEMRSQRQAKETTKVVDVSPDKAAQIKRQELRERKVRAGLDELELWLYDTIRQGLIHLKRKSIRDMAARLIDAQAKGLATRLQALEVLVLSDAEQAAKGLVQLGVVYILLHSYRIQEQLSEALRADVRRAIGWTDNQKTLLEQSGIRDSWLVLAQEMAQEDNLRVARTWLWGKASGRVALELQFAYGERPFARHFAVGKRIEAELVFYPSQHPQRAVIKDDVVMGTVTVDDMALETIDTYPDYDVMLKAYADALTQLAWLDYFPVYLRDMTPYLLEERFLLADVQHKTLTLSPELTTMQQWQILAVSGGHPVDIIAIWNGESLRPLSVWTDGMLIGLVQ